MQRQNIFQSSFSEQLIKNEKNKNQEYVSEADQQKNQQNSNITLIRIPFHVKTLKSLSKVLPQETIRKIQQKEDPINLSINTNEINNFNINLNKKKIIRPMQLLKLKKLVHKTTGKIIKIVQSVENVQTLYDFQQLGDFINTTGTSLLYKQKKYSLQQDDILELIKKTLLEKIKSNTNQNQIYNSQSDQFIQLIQPLSFLRNYNFVPPLCDMFLSKLKKNPEESTHIASKNINFEDQVPELSTSIEIPKFISESQLYKKITFYLQKRPCWLKNTLYYTLYQDGMKNKFTINDFKNVMKYTTYTYRSGPWKHTFCKLGFDPKKDSKSVIFQSMAIKLKQKQVEDYENEIQEDVYDPTFQQLSNRFIRSYQLCDITSETIQQIVQGKLLSKQGSCTKQHGWLNSTQHGKIMKMMKNSVQEVNKNNS